VRTGEQVSVISLRHGRTFASLRRHRNYRLYFFSQAVSVSGNWVRNVAQAWLVLQLTHSVTAVGVLAACQFGPYALLGLVGGVMIDRLDVRRCLIATQAASMVLAGVLGVLALTNLVTAWQVFVIAAINGVVLVLDTPARQAFVIQMVGRHELPNAVALNSSVFNASRIIGPAIGGLIIVGVGVGACFVINAVSYLAIIGGLLAMRCDELFPLNRGTERPALIRGIGEGFAYAWRTPAVLVVLTMMMLTGTMAINFNVLMPVLASHTLGEGADIYGLLSAAFGAGALVGALLSASLARSSWPVLLGGGIALGAGELLLATQHHLLPCLLILLATGAAFSMYTSQSNATLQLTVPDRLRGRVTALYAYAFFGTAPLGGLLAGWLGERGGTSLAFAIGGAVATTSALAGTVWWLRTRVATGAPDAAPADAVSAPAPG
jgi:MFS family permease